MSDREGRCQTFWSGLAFVACGMCQLISGILVMTVELAGRSYHPIHVKGTTLWCGLITLMAGLFPLVLSCRQTNGIDDYKTKIFTCVSSAIIVIINIIGVVVLNIVEWRRYMPELLDLNLPPECRLHVKLVYSMSTAAMLIPILTGATFLLYILITHRINLSRHPYGSGLERLIRLERFMHIYRNISISNIFNPNSPNLTRKGGPIFMRAKEVQKSFRLPFSSMINKTTKKALSVFATVPKIEVIDGVDCKNENVSKSLSDPNCNNHAPLLQFSKSDN